MIYQIPVEAIDHDLLGHLKLASENYVVITHEGKAIGLLLGLEDPEEWWEELLLHHQPFLDRVASARQRIQDGQGVTIETLLQDDRL